MVNIKENEELSKLNHSCAHLMAQAVKNLYPNAKFWVGPVIEEGFYYDMDLDGITLTEEDLDKISREMKKLVKDGKRIVRHEVKKEEALEMFKEDPYKIRKVADRRAGKLLINESDSLGISRLSGIRSFFAAFRSAVGRTAPRAADFFQKTINI